jgi:hypothetical protein
MAEATTRTYQGPTGKAQLEESAESPYFGGRPDTVKITPSAGSRGWRDSSVRRSAKCKLVYGKPSQSLSHIAARMNIATSINRVRDIKVALLA